MKYTLYKDISGEGYKNKGDCTAAIELVKGSTVATVHQK